MAATYVHAFIAECSKVDKSYSNTSLRATSRDWEPMTLTLHALSLVEIKGGAGTSLLHTTLEGPTEYVNGKMDAKFTWIPTWHHMDHVAWHLDYFQKSPFGDRPKTKPGDHGILNAHNHWFILFYHVWGLAWIAIHWDSIWLRDRSHMASLHDFRGVLGWPLDNFFWALTILCSRLLARAWSETPTFRCKIVLFLSLIRAVPLSPPKERKKKEKKKGN